MNASRRVVCFDKSEILPSVGDVLRGWGLPPLDKLPVRTRGALEQALEMLASLVEPRALIAPLSHAEFDALYRASDPPHADTPVARVAPRSAALALFAATLGEAVTTRTSALFDGRDVAHGYLLDASASIAADRLATRAAADFARQCGVRGGELRVLPYSPGYCGWPTEGQRELFERLRPGEIGLSLTESCLMRPLKSVSGVLLAGPPAVHVFEDEFEFCGSCATHECRTRLCALGELVWNG